MTFLDRFIRSPAQPESSDKQPGHNIPDDLTAVNIHRQMLEESGAVGGVRATPTVDETASEKVNPRHVAKKEEQIAEKAIELGDVLDAVHQLRIDMQKVKAEEVPYDVVPRPAVPLGGGDTGTTQNDPLPIVPHDPYRYEVTLTNLGANPVRWNTDRARCRKDGGITLAPNGGTITLKVQSSVWVFAPAGVTTLDVFTKVYLGSPGSSTGLREGSPN